MFGFAEAVLGSIAKKRSNNIQRVSFRNKGDYVVLIHGLVVGQKSMQSLEQYLDSCGYQVLNFRCSFRKYTIHAIAEKFLHNFVVRNSLDKKRKVHFVTHSIGGIVVRDYLQNHTLPNLGRVVMLAPPNHGSDMYALFNRPIIDKYVLGVAGKQVTISEGSYLSALKNKVNFDLGVIAGTKTWNPLSYVCFKGSNDGVVSVKATKIQGMKSHIAMKESHYSMLFSQRVFKNIISFLFMGKF